MNYKYNSVSIYFNNNNNTIDLKTTNTNTTTNINQKAVLSAYANLNFLFATTLTHYVACTSLFVVPFMTVVEYIRDSYVVISTSQLVSSFLSYIILSETLLFISYFWCLYSASLSSSFPSTSIYTVGIISPSSASLLCAITLLLASASVFGATTYILNSIYVSRVAIFTLMLYIIAFTFSTLQACEFLSLEFNLNDSYGFIFLSLTGLHFFHVQVGIMLLFTYLPIQPAEPNVFVPYYLNKSRQGVSYINYTSKGYLSLLYWHFVELVWVFITFCLYWN